MNLTFRGAFRCAPTLGVSRAYARFLSTPVPDVEVKVGEDGGGGLMPVTGEMVRTQLRLAGRSAKVLARHPRLGKELPRLAATRGRSTMRLRLPWLPFRLIDELAAVIGPGSRVFEYGGGGSTLWFLDRGAEVVTVEHHEGWANQLEEATSALLTGRCCAGRPTTTTPPTSRRSTSSPTPPSTSSSSTAASAFAARPGPP